MGQYFKAIVLGNEPKEGEQEVVKSWVCSHEYDNGLKLMEHSYKLGMFCFCKYSGMPKSERPKSGKRRIGTKSCRISRNRHATSMSKIQTSSASLDGFSYFLFYI